MAADPQVKDENLWHFKYSLRKSMIPSFLTADMARKIMLTGKSVVFIHRVCHDNTQLDQRETVKQARYGLKVKVVLFCMLVPAEKSL